MEALFVTGVNTAMCSRKVSAFCEEKLLSFAQITTMIGFAQPVQWEISMLIELVAILSFQTVRRTMYWIDDSVMNVRKGTLLTPPIASVCTARMAQ